MIKQKEDESEVKNKDNLNPEVYKLLTNYEIIFTLNQIFPSTQEISSITSLNIDKTKSNSLSITDNLFYTLSSYPKMKIYLDSLISLYEIKGEILEIISFSKKLSSLYSFLLFSKKLKFITHLLLKIANFINKENGIEEISSFDFLSIDSILEMKNKNKVFFDLISKNYILFFGHENFISQKEKVILTSVIDQFNCINCETCSLEAMKNKFLLHYGKIDTLIQDDKLKEVISKEYIEDFYNEVIEKELVATKKQNDKLKEKVMKYFLIPNNSPIKFNSFLFGILKIIDKIDSKLKKAFPVISIKPYIKENNSQTSEIEEEKQSEIKEIETAPLIHHPCVLENPEKKKFIINNNVIEDSKEKKYQNKEEMIDKPQILIEGRNEKGEKIISRKKYKKYSLLSDKYNL